MTVKKNIRRKNRLNRGLAALGLFVLRCAAFVIFAGIHVKNMPDRMVALAGEYYLSDGAAAGIPAREYLKAEIVQWEDMTHAVVRVFGNLTDTEPDMPFSESTISDLYDQFNIEFKFGKWVVTKAVYSFQGRWSSSENPYYEGNPGGDA